MGEFSTSLSGPLGLWRPSIARLDRLARRGGPTIVSAKGASPTTLLALGGLPDGVPFSKDAQASFKASWVVPSKAERASKARSGESEVINVGLF